MENVFFKVNSGSNVKVNVRFLIPNYRVKGHLNSTPSIIQPYSFDNPCCEMIIPDNRFSVFLLSIKVNPIVSVMKAHPKPIVSFRYHHRDKSELK